ncbi:MAG: TetR family transcriptional regulator [Polyangiales bacterium]
MISLRERKKTAVRDALIAQALRLFRERSFDGVTVDEIAAAAEVSRRSFFRYFPNKEAVLLGRRQDQLARFRELLGKTKGFDSVRAACLALADEYVKMRAQILEERAIVAASASLSAHDLEVDRAFEAAIEGALGGGRRAKICAAAVVGAIRVVLEEWAERGGKLDLRAVGTEALDLIAPVAPPKFGDRQRTESTRSTHP